MIDLKNYYEFFSNNHFMKYESLMFLADGWFSIRRHSIATSSYYIEVYSEKAELMFTFHNPDDVAILHKTCTIVEKSVDRGGFIIYRKGQEKYFIEFDDVKHTYIKDISGSSAIISYQNELFTLNVSIDDEDFYKLNKLHLGTRLSKADCYGNVVYKNVLDDYEIINKQGKIFKLNGIMDIEFLNYRRAIISEKGCSFKLVSYEKFNRNDDYFQNILNKPDVLLMSDNFNGIRTLGDSSIVFEKSLIADTVHGAFVAKYDEKKTPISVTIGNRFVYPYTITYKDKTAFYPVKTGDFFEVDYETLFVFFYDNRFYPLMIDKSIEYHREALEQGTNNDANYALRIAQALFDE